MDEECGKQILTEDGWAVCNRTKDHAEECCYLYAEPILLH